MQNNEKKEKNERKDLSEGINEFARKHRKPIFISIGVIVLALIGIVASISLMDLFRKKAISAAEDFNRRYEELRFTISEESSAEKTDALLAELAPFAQKSSGYAGGRAWAIIAGIRADKKEWADAESAWLAAAKAASKTFLAPPAYFNAAAAAEEQGKTAEAIEYYTQSVSLPAAFPAAARAQFSIGRLRESLGEGDAALEAYREVITRWPYDAVWTSLAQSRIIALELE
jgi:tetratricopeptide (TPR) repeat protein